MTNKPMLKLDWCSHEAAKYAVEHWHYSRCMPAGKVVHVGVWEDEKYIGCVMFSRGANINIAKPYGLEQVDVCELTRVALNKHKTPVSKILSISVKMLKKQSPGLRLVVSYSDLEQGHVGGIYQANNWIYCGYIELDSIIINGQRFHPRSVFSKYGFRGVEQLRNIGLDAKSAVGMGKHKYLMPLDDAMRKQIEPLRKPYPKRGTGETDNAAQSNAQTGGASPTVPLLTDLTV